MYTRCPKCSTCFRVTDRHLAIANGKVRCGQCQHVFNATQHAIDDPQQPPKTKAPSNTAFPGPAGTSPSINPVTATPSAEIKAEEKIAAVDKETITIQKETSTEIVTKTRHGDEAHKPPRSKPVFTPDETLLADISMVDNEDINEINLDAPTEAVKEIIIDEENNDFFDDDFDDEFEDNRADDAKEASSKDNKNVLGNDIDLDSAIEELTQANRLATEKKPATPETGTETISVGTDKDNIFSTDAYDATSATSVEDIFNEMEGQLSLNIDVTTPGQQENDEDEFDLFGPADEEDTEQSVLSGESHEKSIEEQFIEELELKKNAPVEDIVDTDELFDEIDLSDFDDDKVNEAPVQEESGHTNKNSVKDSEDNAIPFQLRNDLEKLQAPTRRKLHPVLSIFVILVLLCVTFAQLAYFQAYEVVKIIPGSRPYLEEFCDKVHCIYSGPRDIKQIKLLNRDVRQHPKEKNALLITATMINQASFAQPYPDIHIRLSDISGNVVAERTFNAKTYMGKLSNPFLLMKSKTPVHLNFEVVDPGKDAVNFEFTFQ